MMCSSILTGNNLHLQLAMLPLMRNRSVHANLNRIACIPLYLNWTPVMTTAVRRRQRRLLTMMIARMKGAPTNATPVCYFCSALN